MIKTIYVRLIYLHRIIDIYQEFVQLYLKILHTLKEAISVKEIKKVCVAGGGLMGRQIAMNTALHGYEVYLTDTFEEALDDVRVWSEEYLESRIVKGRLSEEEVKRASSNFKLTNSLEEAAKDSDLVIEAIIEDRAIKEKFFSDLDKIVKKETIIATNSSYMVSSLFVEYVSHPERLANLHYFNPALVMKLTEVVQGEHTSKETVDVLMDFSRKTGKDPIWVKKEIDGFIANRIIRVIRAEAYYLLDEGIASPEDIDKAVEKGLNHPMGPFRLQDLTGIDLGYLTAKRVLDETGVKGPGYDILKEKYEAGELGKKVGKGWYDYTKK